MRGDRAIRASERWFRLLLQLYPSDFREEMGDAVVEAYCDRARDALNRGGVIGSRACGCARLRIRCVTARASGRGQQRHGDVAATGASMLNWRPAG